MRIKALQQTSAWRGLTGSAGDVGKPTSPLQLPWAAWKSFTSTPALAAERRVR